MKRSKWSICAVLAVLTLLISMCPLSSSAAVPDGHTAVLDLGGCNTFRENILSTTGWRGALVEQTWYN